MTGVIVEHAVEQGQPGGALALGGDCGVDVQTHGVGIFTELFHHLLAHHLPQVRGIQGDFSPVIAGLDRHLGGFVILGLGDLAGFQHATQYHVAASEGALRGADRVQHGGCLGETRDDGDLVQGQILDLLAEVDLGGRADPECPVAEGDLVEIEGEDLVFGEVLLDAPGKEHFLDLAYKSLLVAQEEVAGHLLGNGTGALTRLAGDGPDGGGTDDADGVNARVLIEAGIFGGEYGIDHGLGNFVQPQGDATNFAKLGDQFPVPAVDLHGGSQFDIAQGADVRQLGLDVEVDADEAGNAQHSTQHHDNKQANEPFQHGRTTNRLKISQRAQSIAFLPSRIRGFPVRKQATSRRGGRVALQGTITKGAAIKAERRGASTFDTNFMTLIDRALY